MTGGEVTSEGEAAVSELVDSRIERRERERPEISDSRGVRDNCLSIKDSEPQKVLGAVLLVELVKVFR